MFQQRVELSVEGRPHFARRLAEIIFELRCISRARAARDRSQTSRTRRNCESGRAGRAVGSAGFMVRNLELEEKRDRSGTGHRADRNRADALRTYRHTDRLSMSGARSRWACATFDLRSSQELLFG